MLQGQTKNIAMNPVANKKIDENETFAPFQIDLRNGVLTDAGNWEGRKGYAQKWDTGTDLPIKTLIPEDSGIAIDTANTIYKLGDTITQYSGDIFTGSNRPTWTKYKDILLLAAGNWLMKITGIGTGSATKVNIGQDYGLPSRVDFVSTLGDLIVLSQYGETLITWYDSAGLEGTITTNSANVRKDGTIQYQIEYGNRLYFFKEHSVEVRVDNGSLVSRDELKMNVGLSARDSVVKANNTLYWYYKDAFYVLNGASPQVISDGGYSDSVHEMHSPENLYGFDFQKDKVIRWFEPVQGKCFVYDYVKNFFYEDNYWQYATFQRMPIYSYMELDNNQYIGSYEPDGLIHEWSDAYYDDNGNTIRVYRRFAVKLSENRVRINRLRFRFKSATSDYAASNQFTYRFRLDRQKWSNERFIDLEDRGDYDNYHDEYDIGQCKEIEIEVVNSASVQFLLTDILLTANGLGN